MSTWNSRFKYFSSKKQSRIVDFLLANGRDAWDEFVGKTKEKFDGRIISIYSDCIKGVGDHFNGNYVSEEQFNEDCKEVNKMINELLKKYEEELK